MKVWFDCTAAAHGVVMRPLIERLLERGDEVLVTAREYGQTIGLLEMLEIPHTVVGRHGGGSRGGKAVSLLSRSGALVRPVREFGPDLAVGHGSVDLALVSSLLRVPSAQMQDYEFAGLQRQLAFRAAKRVVVPDSIPVERMKKIGAGPGKLFRYPGLKEDYYLADFEPDSSVIAAERSTLLPCASRSLMTGTNHLGMRSEDSAHSRGMVSKTSGFWKRSINSSL